jgi:hypothetical protein
MTLFSFVSRQVWPQVLSVLAERPERLVLFHTSEAGESANPAKRLQAFFAQTGLLDAGKIELVPVPHDHFGNIVDGLAGVAEKYALDETNCRVNVTGGNKLMAMAAAEWCRLAGVPCFYLERNLRVFRFQPQGSDLLPLDDYRLDPHLASKILPIALLRCQWDSAEIVDEGQELRLNEQGGNLPEQEFEMLYASHYDFAKCLQRNCELSKTNPGDGLEYATAFALLKLGVPVVQRSVRVSSKLLRGAGGKEEGELDLVFNWAGKLWIVDCKNRLTADDRIDKLRTELLKGTGISPKVEQMLSALTDELRSKDLKPLKEDLLAMAEAGGLLGRAICVRRAALPEQAADFARSRNIPVVMSNMLLRDLRPLLYPNEPASIESLRGLAAARNRPRI